MAKTQTDKMQALSVHRQGRSLKKGFSTEGKTQKKLKSTMSKGIEMIDNRIN